MPKRNFLGLSRTVWAVVILVLLGLGVLTLLAGGFGRSLFTGVNMPDWLIVGQPHPELPAEEIFNILGFSVTNTIFSAWFTILVLGSFFYFALRKSRLVPKRLQMLAEFAVGYIYNFCEDIAGKEMGRRFFPVVATIFFFVMGNALLALLPGFGSILITNGHGEAVHLFRGVNTDINLPLALALISFFFVESWGLRKVPFFQYMSKFFNFRQFVNGFKKLFKGRLKDGISGIAMGAIDIFIGLIELLSEFVRILSFTFRLFGNMTGGEILLLMMMFLAPFLSVLPFYGLELLVGFIQALIFAGLTLVFASIATTPHNAEEAH